jgi:hypothetical protein
MTYLVQRWSLTAHMIYGYVGKDIQTDQQEMPDYLNYDLSAVKTMGKWTFGPVAYGPADLSKGGADYTRQSQGAVGGLTGYTLA